MSQLIIWCKNAFANTINILSTPCGRANRIRQMYTSRLMDEISTEKFGPGLPSVGDIEKQTALVLVNTNPAMDYMAPLPENVIPVGGLHIKDPKPLPKVAFYPRIYSFLCIHCGCSSECFICFICNDCSCAYHLVDDICDDHRHNEFTGKRYCAMPSILNVQMN